MADIIKFGMHQFHDACMGIAAQIKAMEIRPSFIMGVPRGGIPAAVEISKLVGLRLVGDVEEWRLYKGGSLVIIDDIIDSGSTRDRYSEFPFFALCSKEDPEAIEARQIHPKTYAACGYPKDSWIEFWWEKNEAPAEDAIRRILEVIGEDPNREGLLETPARVLKSYKKLFGGYAEKDVASILKTFEDGACDSMVIVKDVEMFSTCEHHMLPFFGKCHIAYIPNGKVVGVSKLVRLMEVFTRRLQIQERIGDQITDALMTHLGCKGAACVIEAQHFCMKARGVEKQHSKMITSSLKGVFLEKPETRAEFMSMIKG